MKRVIPKIDPKVIISKAKEKNNRCKVSFTFDESLYNNFQNACAKEDVACSRVLEELMSLFLVMSNNKKK